MRTLEEMIKLAARSGSHVLINGATGTGKTTLARRIHDLGPRARRPFVSINLATLHEGTLESELFGHERGAFTGADQKRIGKLEHAQGGTVFLDEIGDLSLRLQARLLEFMQSRTIVPIGGTREVKLDVRVIAATHRNLEDAVKRGEFREDLFHRLRVVSFRMKSILERSDELDSIIHACLMGVCESLGVTILRLSAEAVRELEGYPWPGNLREVRNVLEYAAQSSQGGVIEHSDLPDWFLDSKRAEDERLFGFSTAKPLLGVAEVPLTLDYNESVNRFEKEYLSWALHRFDGKVNRTARGIQMNKTTLMRRIRTHCLNAQAIRP